MELHDDLCPGRESLCLCKFITRVRLDENRRMLDIVNRRKSDELRNKFDKKVAPFEPNRFHKEGYNGGA